MVSVRERSVDDQAAGLRRMFRQRPTQVVAFASGQKSCGLTSLVVQTAVTLAEAGQRVLLIDENSGPGRALSNLGINPPGDLWDSLVGKIPLERVIVSVMANLWAVSAAGTAERLHQDSPEIRGKLDLLMTPMQGGSDFVLIDSHLSARGGLSVLSSTAPHMVVVVGAETASITDSYSLIKRLASERGRDGFQVVITRPQSEDMAHTVFDNLRRTAGKHLGVRLDLLAVIRIPTAEHVADALSTRLPLAQAPYRPGARA